MTIDKPLVQQLVEPVYIEPPGEPWTDVAKRLGVHEESLRYAMNRGDFRVRHIPPFGRNGYGRGKPVPLIYRPGALNPCAVQFAPPDPAWGCLWRYHGSAVPDDLSQTLERRPRLRPYRSETRFRGWNWVCPACRKEVEIIYLPLPVPDVASYLGLIRREGGDVRREDETYLLAPHAHPLTPLSPLQTFACVRCHRVRYLTRTFRQGWNEFVAYLTGGLLYGDEVTQPINWFARRRAYRPAKRLSRQDAGS